MSSNSDDRPIILKNKTLLDHMDKEGAQDENTVKFVWKWSYTWVLVFNILYVLLFYWLMKTYVVYAG